MSHYMVMVIKRKGSYKGVDELLAPYDENLEVPQYVRKTKPELIKSMAALVERVKRSAALNAELGGNEDAYNEKVDALESRDYVSWRYLGCEEAKRLEKVDPADEDAVFEEVKREYEGSLNVDGDYVSTYNPNSKWDWYEIGGRFCGELIPKKRGHYHVDEAKAGEIDWNAMFTIDPEEEKERSEFWDEYVMGGIPEKEYFEKRHFVLYKREYFLERYKTKEEYIRQSGLWTPYAVLDDKGWHAAGDMGWFGCSSETDEEANNWADGFRKRFVDTLDPEDEVTIVDCHI